MKWQYRNPVHIVFTQAFHKALAELIGNKKNVLVMCSERFRLSRDFARLKDSLADFQCFTNIERNPSFESHQKAIDFATSAAPEVIVAIGQSYSDGIIQFLPQRSRLVWFSKRANKKYSAHRHSHNSRLRQ
ncbi:MAG: iron-containing alcohol dehydrogenase [Deltaproteobacteria bacterium]|nr:iron-containing alcohol dehydrogenase [Deltaproteobacteria bacterium]